MKSWCETGRRWMRARNSDRKLPLLWALDFNVDPMSSLVVQMVDGKVLVLDEIVVRNGTTMDASEEFLNRYPDHWAGVHIYGDASGPPSRSKRRKPITNWRWLTGRPIRRLAWTLGAIH